MITKTAYDNSSEASDRDRNLAGRNLDYAVAQAAFANLAWLPFWRSAAAQEDSPAGELSAKVHALDFSDGMLAQAKNKVSWTM